MKPPHDPPEKWRKVVGKIVEDTEELIRLCDDYFGRRRTAPKGMGAAIIRLRAAIARHKELCRQLDYPKHMDHEAGRRVLFEVADILEGHRVPFFLVFGTALGAYHLGGFVDGDRDIDLGVLWEETPWGDLAIAFHNAGFQVLERNIPFKLQRGFRIIKDRIHIDIHGWMKNGDERFTHDGRGQYAWVHPASIIESRVKTTLYDRVFYLPAPTEEYLRREYGDTWDTVLGTDWQFDIEQSSRVYGYARP